MILYRVFCLFVPVNSCDVPLPAKPLEVRVTFSANEDSEIALVLILGGDEGEFREVSVHREIVLRGWGQEVSYLVDFQGRYYCGFGHFSSNPLKGTDLGVMSHLCSLTCAARFQVASSRPPFRLSTYVDKTQLISCVRALPLPNIFSRRDWRFPNGGQCTLRLKNTILQRPQSGGMTKSSSYASGGQASYGV